MIFGVTVSLTTGSWSQDGTRSEVSSTWSCLPQRHPALLRNRKTMGLAHHTMPCISRSNDNVQTDLIAIKQSTLLKIKCRCVFCNMSGKMCLYVGIFFNPNS